VRFRVRAPGAATVAVIGSWNDWAADRPEQRLRATRDPELWEGWVDVGAGDHRYHFLVDGRPVRPVDAPRYLPDDFGGEDGVLAVEADSVYRR
jgi:1,4-alpha-glucan branching enzyme